MTAAAYQIRAEGLDLIERGRDTVLRARVHQYGEAAPPASGTVSVYDRAGTAIVSAAAATIAGGEARYTVPAATTAALTPEVGWRTEWVLVLQDGTTRTHRRDAALVVARLYPPASLADVWRRVPALDPSHPRPIVPDLTVELLEGLLLDAWLGIEDYLLGAARYPWLVLSPQALRPAHVLGTIALAFESAAVDRPELAVPAATYRKQYADALATVDLTVVLDDADATATDTVAAAGSVWLCGR